MLVCKNNSYAEGKLTIGKIYNPMRYITAQGFLTTSKFVCVLCDDGTAIEFSEARFISIEEHREEQLNKVL